MPYAAAGYCYDTGEAATLALNSYRVGVGGYPCPYVWEAGNLAARSYTYSTTTQLCTASTTKVTFASCTEPGPIGPPDSSIWQLTPEQGSLIAGAILLLWGIAWVIRTIARTLNVDEKENNP